MKKFCLFLLFIFIFNSNCLGNINDCNVVIRNNYNLLNFGVEQFDMDQEEPNLKIDYRIEFDDVVNSVDVSANGIFLIASCENKFVKIFNVATGDFLGDYDVEGAIHSVSFSENGNCVLISYDCTAVIISALFTEEKVFKHAHPVKMAIFSSNCENIITASGFNAMVWDVEHGNHIRNFEHEDFVSYIALSPDGKALLTVAGFNAILWDLETGKKIQEFVHEDIVNSANFSADGLLIITSAGCNAVLWNKKTGGRVKIFKHDLVVRSAEFHPDYASILTGSDDGTIRLWSLEFGDCLKKYKYPFKIKTAMFNSDGTKIIAAYNRISCLKHQLNKISLTENN